MQQLKIPFALGMVVVMCRQLSSKGAYLSMGEYKLELHDSG